MIAFGYPPPEPIIGWRLRTLAAPGAIGRRPRALGPMGLIWVLGLTGSHVGLGRDNLHLALGPALPLIAASMLATQVLARRSGL